jgi:hypothetical protein
LNLPVALTGGFLALLRPILPRNPPIATQPEFSLMQARLCFRPLAYGKGLAWPIGTRRSATRALSIDSVFLSKDIARYRKIGLTQLSIPANHIERYLRPKMAESDLFHRINAWPIRFDFSKPLISEFVLTFQNPCPADSIHDSDSGVTSIN